MRKTQKQLEQIKKKYNISELWSWSKYNTYKTDKFEYFLKYIKQTKQDRNDSIYGASGNAAHDIIEKFYNKEIKYEEMIDEYEDALFKFNIAKLKYDRCDEDKNEKIANKYEECMRHFFLNHQILPYKLILEEFLLIKVGEFLFQSYLDCVHKEIRDGKAKYLVTDFKTSSIYTGKKINKERGQLVLYAEGLRQKLNIPLEDIIIRWAFLKYVEVEQMQANGKVSYRNIERNKIGESLTAGAKMWLKKEKYSEEEIEDFIFLMEETNNILCLPESVREKFVIKDCYVEIPLDQKVIDDLKSEIISTIIEIKKLENEYIKTKNEKLFWQDVDKEHSYYMANLSSYSRNIHKPYDEYLTNIEIMSGGSNSKRDDDDDLKDLLNLLD